MTTSYLLFAWDEIEMEGINTHFQGSFSQFEDAFKKLEEDDWRWAEIVVIRYDGEYNAPTVTQYAAYEKWWIYPRKLTGGELFEQEKQAIK